MKKQPTKMDFWVPLAVILLLVGAFLKWTAMDRLPQTEPFSYRMVLSDLQGEISPGDTVLCISGKQPVGTVAEVETAGSQTVLTLEAAGFPIDGGFRSNVYDILPGFEDTFYTESATLYAIVTNVG